VFGNKGQRGILGPKREEVIGDWRKLHREELTQSLGSIISVFLGDLGVRGRIILKLILQKYSLRM
jgi:hypothetical protein